MGTMDGTCGALDGTSPEGREVGFLDGESIGTQDGPDDGRCVDDWHEGCPYSRIDGALERIPDGTQVGNPVGTLDGLLLGILDVQS